MSRCWLKNDTRVVIPAQAGIQHFLRDWIPAFAGMTLVFCTLLLSSCGGSSGPASNSTNLNGSIERQTYSDLINSPSYAGYLVVYFPKESSVRLEDGGRNLTAKSANGVDRVARFNALLSEFPEARLERSSTEEPERLDRRRAMLEKRSGKKLTDWNSVYHIYIEDPAKAGELYNKLKGIVGFVQPASKTSLTSIEGTPDLAGTGEQGYLKSYEETGGLGAQSAWAAGATGRGITVVDIEGGVNFDHEDLPIEFASARSGGSVLGAMGVAPNKPGDSDEYPPAISHGSAVIGILAGIDNGYGIKGFAPESRILISAATGVIEANVGFMANPRYSGEVVLIEHATAGALGYCLGGLTPTAQYGCMPVESDPYNYAAIAELTAAGVTVIEGAGNGTMNLNNPDAYWDDTICGNPDSDPDHCINILGEGGDAGAIMVGAVQAVTTPSVSLNPLNWSNCGTRIDVSSWGRNVVTASYPVPELGDAFGWRGTPPSADFNTDPNNYYMNDFGGTSSSAAIVAGAVALLQSYAKNLMGDFRYITPPKIREILKNTGRPVSGDDGCNLGVQPDIPSAMAAIDTLWVETLALYPQMAEYKEFADPANTVSEDIRFTVDGLDTMWRNEGVGIVCTEYSNTRSDPLCPYALIGVTTDPIDCTNPSERPYCIDNDLIPHIEVPFDFDEDGRADLTVWTEEGWKIDMSSSPTDDPQCNSEGHLICRDNYGEWDISVDMPPLEDTDAWIWPLVQDWNSDGRADFAVYDKKNSKLYVTFTTDDVLAGTRNSWDWIIDYSAEYQDQMTSDPYDRVNYKYARPVPGDYDGDSYIDFALACSDGYWRIDYGGADRSAYGTFDDELQYLTEAQLAEAPGWAYLPAQGDYDLQGTTDISFKAPDGIPDDGRWFMCPVQDFINNGWCDWFEPVAHMFGGNDWIPIASDYRFEVGGVLTKDGAWKRMNTNYVMGDYIDNLVDETVVGVFGPDCYPVATTYSGFNDMGVLCSNGEWRIKYGPNGATKYSQDIMDADGIRRVSLSNQDMRTLPPTPSYGGISYQDVRKNIDKFRKLFPSRPVPINVDTFGSE